MSERASADRLRERLAANGDTLRMYTGEAMYHAQVEYTCQLLDVVDEVADSVTAGLITDAIYERLSGDGVSEAAERIRSGRLAAECLSRTALSPLNVDEIMNPGARGRAK